ncbi:MAG: methylmalonyl Co-A mutase-associated GTPase MeaB [Burkholderiaceae bacterium]
MTGAPAGLGDALARGERRALAKAITLVESTRADHRDAADALLQAVLSRTGRSLRLGISGVPGVGKSTFIEALGRHVIAAGHRIAVLAIDPSSTLSGGSILGDKTRMLALAAEPSAFIRPSPSAGTLGGVARMTREAMLLCEAAGFDVIVVETVGVGQSESAVAGMTDMLALLQLPNAGDELQAIKKGILELADLVVINKADIDPAAALRAQTQIASSLRILGEGRGAPPVMRASALDDDGIDRFWSTVLDEARARRESGRFEKRRRGQALDWMWDLVRSRLEGEFRSHPAVSGDLAATLEAVAAGRDAPPVAARRLLGLFRGGGRPLDDGPCSPPEP